MKKLIQTVLILIPVALAATGCDFFRKLAGRPTSDQIAAMAEAIRLEESARIADSLRKALAEPQEDSAATTPTPATPAVQAASTPTASSPVTATTTPAAAAPATAPSAPAAAASAPATAAPAPAGDLKRFYVVMASFGNSANANKYASILEAKGYPATILKRGSYQVVAVCGTDDEAAIKQSFDEIRRQDFCPQGVWIIDRNGK